MQVNFVNNKKCLSIVGNHLGDADGGQSACVGDGKMQPVLRDKELIHLLYDLAWYDVLQTVQGERRIVNQQKFVSSLETVVRTSGDLLLSRGSHEMHIQHVLRHTYLLIIKTSSQIRRADLTLILLSTSLLSIKYLL